MSMLLIRVVLFLGLLVQIHGPHACAQEFASIPFDDSRFPSDDLLYEGRILRSDEAHELSLQGVKLVDLNPAPSALWNKTNPKFVSDELEVQGNELFEFKGALLSASGLFRFNAQVGSTTVIAHLDKTLHTMLLRKNFLRLLGYDIPAMKWVPEFSVQFSGKGELKEFMESMIPRATAGASCRWIKEIQFPTQDELNAFATSKYHEANVETGCDWKLALNGFSYGVKLKDVSLSVPSSKDHFNLSQGVPPKNLTNRTLRALIIPYALLDLGESANKYEWAVGRISDGEIILPHFTRGSFSTTKDDARWILKRLSSLSEEEIRTAVRLSHFPTEVSLLIEEKLLSRINELFKLFKIDVKKIKVDNKISHGEYLKKGKLQIEDWPGYASRFSHGDPESPFRDFHWYALAKVQAVLMDNIFAQINKELILSNPKKERADFIFKQFKKGLDHFVETGEFLIFPVSTWFSPIADASLRASRDIVVGNYLGTDNLVQIADSIGWTYRIGGHVGVENIDYVPNVSFAGKVTVSRTWSHLKPLRNLKSAMKEPYRNIAVPLLRWQVKNKIKKISKLESSENPDQDWNLKEEDSALAEIVSALNTKLGVGESLIFTESFVPQINGQASTNSFLAPVDFSAQASVNENIIRRIQILRKDSKTIQVYDDRGFSRGFSFDFAVQKFIPIMMIGLGKQKGDYGIKVFDVNINPDVKENPELFKNTAALADFMQSGSSELLASASKPHQVKANFVDKTFKFALLPWRIKKLKTATIFDIESRDGLTGNFMAFTDEKQTGWNWEAFSKDLINLGMSKIYEGAEWAGNPFQNPAETIHGMGTTKSVRFEASLDENKEIEERFMRLTDKWEGWSAKIKTVKKKMKAINEKFGFTVFNETTLGNIEKLKLFNVSVNLNLYEEGIRRLSTISEDRLIQIENYKERRLGYEGKSCPGGKVYTRRLSSGQKVESCGTLQTVISKSESCQKKIRKDKTDATISKCLTSLLRKAYEKMDYQDLEAVIGKENIFVHGSVNGFRNGDEVLNDPIQSNTEGRIGGRFWNGPMDVIQRLLGISSGEFNGYWLRERL